MKRHLTSRSTIWPRITAGALGLALGLALATTRAHAAPGDLDPSFGAGGTVTTPIGPSSDEANAVLLLPGGGTVVAGDAFDGTKYNFALARYTASGALDGSFGTGGVVTTAVGLNHDFALTLARQPDGKILAGGYTSGDHHDAFDFALVRYLDDGSLDPDFGDGGIVVTEIEHHEDIPYAMALQPDGKIVLAGLSNNQVDFDFALVRYLDDGSLDPDFGDGGIVITPIGASDEVIRGIVLDPSGHITVAGYTLGANYDVALARYDEDGELDASFGSGGIVVTPVGTGHDFALALVRLSSGKLVVAGHAVVGGNDNFALLRYQDDGTLDASFGTGGKVTTAVGSGTDVAAALVVQPDGKLVAAGTVEVGGTSDLGVVRYDANGTLDTSFGTGGKVITPIGASFDGANAAALESDGRIVAAGFTFNGADNDFAVVRYKGSICANGIHEPGEPCDDGNLLDGDCCASSCRLDPAGTACTSDGNLCTTDQCNAGGTCTHPNNSAPCEDGVFCNGPDTCGGGSCTVHAGNPCAGGPECADSCHEATDTCFDAAGTACTSDGNPCTTDQCNGSGACAHPNNSAPCSDGFFCNGADTCSGGACAVHAGNPCAGGAECADSCNEAGDNCFSVAGTPCAGDGNLCTDDRCNGSGACAHPANSAPCSDGVFCNGADTCGGGSCSVHAGDPCAGGTECADTCNEAADDCLDPAGTACTDEGNACTTDTCDGGGTCAHPPRGAGAVCRPVAGPCDVAEACDGTAAPCPADEAEPDGTTCEDGNPCTTTQTCTGGVCGGGSALVCPLCERCDGVGGCLPEPQPVCRRPRAQRSDILILRGPTGASDRVLWQWRNGEDTPFAALGDPVAGDDYALCVYEDGGSSLLFRAMAPAASTCGPRPCWKLASRGSFPGPGVDPKGFRYTDSLAANDGMRTIVLAAGETGRAKIILKGKGLALPLPSFSSVDLPLLVQLQREGAAPGECWEATFGISGTTANGGGVVRARSE